MLPAPNIATQVGTVSREVDAIPAQIAADCVHVALLLTPPRVPLLGSAQVPVFDGAKLTPEIIVAFRPLLPELGFVAANIDPIVANVTDVAADVARKG